MNISDIKGQVNLMHLLEIDAFIKHIDRAKAPYTLQSSDLDFISDTDSTFSGRTDIDGNFYDADSNDSMDTIEFEQNEKMQNHGFVNNVHQGLQERTSLLSAIGRGHMRELTHQDFGSFTNYIEFFKKAPSLTQSKIIDNFNQILSFSDSSGTEIKLATIDENFVTRVRSDQRHSMAVAPLDVMLGLGLIIRALPELESIRNTYQEACYYIASSVVTKFSETLAQNPSILRFELHDLVDVLNQFTAYAKLPNVKLVKKLDPCKSLGNEQLSKLFETPFYKSKPEDNIACLFPISAGYGIFDNHAEISALFEVLKETFHGRPILYISDHWHSDTYDALSMYSRIMQHVDGSDSSGVFLTAETKADNYTRALQEGSDFLKNYSGALEAIGERPLIERSSDFDVATGFINSQQERISVAEGNLFNEQFPNLAEPESSYDTSDINRIKAIQLVYVMYLSGKLAYLADEKAQRESNLFHLPHASTDQLTAYRGLIERKLETSMYYEVLKFNNEFIRSSKKIYMELTKSSLFIFNHADRFSPAYATLKPFSKVDRKIFENRTLEAAFYQAQQLSCRYSIYTMALVLAYNMTNKLTNLCYPGQPSAHVDALIKLIGQCSQPLESTLFQQKSPSGTPPRKKHTGPVIKRADLSSMFVASPPTKAEGKGPSSVINDKIL